MATPFHQHASTPLAGPTATVLRSLLTQAPDAIATATASALSRLEPLVRSWGARPTALPTVEVEDSRPDTLGSVTLVWSGDEANTMWPSMAAQLLVVPSPPDSDARLALLTTRSPNSELATHRLGSVHRRRIVDVATQRFLQELASEIAGPGPMHATDAGVARFDRRPAFLHHVREVAMDADELARHLVADPVGLSTAATARALDGAADALAAGRFRAPTSLRTRVGTSSAGTLGVIELAWESDEEATGWPQLDLSLVVEATSTGSRLAAVSHRMPGYDMSSNRVDKRHRDEVIRGLGSDVVDAVVETLPVTSAPHTVPDLHDMAAH